VIAERLRTLRASGRWPRIPIGINIGKSKVTELADAPEDYLYSFRKLREFADYIVLNVSSPNTPACARCRNTTRSRRYCRRSSARTVMQENRCS
jgi:dihydroorotate dehydrogenase